jgi:hypothetical protein
MSCSNGFNGEVTIFDGVAIVVFGAVTIVSVLVGVACLSFITCNKDLPVACDVFISCIRLGVDVLGAVVVVFAGVVTGAVAVAFAFALASAIAFARASNIVGIAIIPSPRSLEALS